MRRTTLKRRGGTSMFHNAHPVRRAQIENMRYRNQNVLASENAAKELAV
jgi:hypothetical protein